MIAKVITSSSIEGLMSYLTEKEHTVIDMNKVLMQKSIDPVVSEFKRLQGQNNRCRKPNFHIILSFGKDEQLSIEKRDLILHDFIAEFVGKDQMWVAIGHPDSDKHQHLHIAMNRVQSNGTVLSSKHTAYRCLEICRKLENKHQLQQLSNFKTENDNKRKELLKGLIDAIIPKVQSMNQFKKELERRQFKVLQGRGIVFVDKANGAKIKGSALGRAYSLMALQMRIDEQSISSEVPSNQVTSDSHVNESASENLLKIAATILETLSESNGATVSQQEEEDRKKRKRRKRGM